MANTNLGTLALAAGAAEHLGHAGQSHFVVHDFEWVEEWEGSTYNEPKLREIRTNLVLIKFLSIGQAKVDFGTRLFLVGGVYRQQEQLGRPERE